MRRRAIGLAVALSVLAMPACRPKQAAWTCGGFQVCQLSAERVREPTTGEVDEQLFAKASDDEPTPEKLAAAANHGIRAAALFAEQNFDAAAFEWKHAYDLSGDVAYLGDIARVRFLQHDWAGGTAAATIYLKRTHAVPMERRNELETAMSGAAPRIAWLTFQRDEGFTVQVDDGPKLQCPVRGQIPVNVGRRVRISASKRGWSPCNVLLSPVGSESEASGATTGESYVIRARTS